MRGAGTMAGNGGASISRVSGASLSAAAAAAGGSTETRFALQERRSRWGGCFGGLSCFGSQKGGKRIVPASHIPDVNISGSHTNGSQSATLSNQNAALNISLLAPPSSPASFTNSTLPSTAQSPSCFLSVTANSLGGDPSSTMFVTGPYAHETQLVSPPAFSTTEPSTAPFTPPPELAHLTTPSSPDVPFARFLSSSVDLKGASKENGMPSMPSSDVLGSDLQASYALYPGSPSSSLISPASGTPRTGMSSPFPERDVASHWGASLSAHNSPHSRNGPSKLFGPGSTSRNSMLPADSSFFCPATSAQFYLDQAQQSFPSYNHCGGKINCSREADAYSSGGNRHNQPCKQDVEEIEAYRASFGFSADEIIAMQSYVEKSEPADDSFTMSPFTNNKFCSWDSPKIELNNRDQKMKTIHSTMPGPASPKINSDQHIDGVGIETLDPSKGLAGFKQNDQSGDVCLSDGVIPARKWGCDQTFLNTSVPDISNRVLSGQSCSDAEIDYRRVRSLRDTHGIMAWRNSLP